ncbi:septal ring lytic transglycosylase RlpA family protein [Novosphingobium mathurense]|uniref:Endolytic peptidoglycan transglycosylase RlpA n=1 Tax=Novosphingobium mathurense TaxID=428990 RepID=A0A1U6GRY9_9SPHN|nr:septal ring lytic transglycosylase RlpA family protein [Novosphingobium mathurense]SLJ86254.1 rare lipoprotein A [Novosphingobium mathurense]
MSVRPGNRKASLLVALAALVTLPLAGPIHAADVAVPELAPQQQAAPALTAPAASTVTIADIAPATPGIDAAEIEAPEFDPIGSGMASYYGNQFAGSRTASGDLFDPRALTAAHRTLPFGSKVRVTNEATGDSVIVTINDRGPFHGNRVIDLSRAAADEIGLTRAGKGRVELALLAD